MKCIHYTRAESDHAIVQQRLRKERNPRLRIGLRRALIEFGKTMSEHRNCRCQESGVAA